LVDDRDRRGRGDRCVQLVRADEIGRAEAGRQGERPDPVVLIEHDVRLALEVPTTADPHGGMLDRSVELLVDLIRGGLCHRAARDREAADCEREDGSCCISGVSDSHGGHDA
jgi:hypothetical protein